MVRNLENYFLLVKVTSISLLIKLVNFIFSILESKSDKNKYFNHQDVGVKIHVLIGLRTSQINTSNRLLQ